MNHDDHAKKHDRKAVIMARSPFPSNPAAVDAARIGKRAELKVYILKWTFSFHDILRRKLCRVLHTAKKKREKETLKN